MPKSIPKTFEEKVEFNYKRYLTLAQYVKKLADGTMTHEDLRAMARAKAVQQETDEQIRIKRKQINADEDLEDDEVYRDERMTAYEKHYEWDDAGDLALLINLVELEVQFRAIRRDLARVSSLSDKEKYWKALRENSESQNKLQVSLGIDKKSRDAAKASGNPMENWQDIKDEVGDWVDMLISEFPEEAEKVNTEQELKDLMKIKLSWPFEVIDSVVYNLKRVSGSPISEDTVGD